MYIKWKFSSSIYQDRVTADKTQQKLYPPKRNLDVNENNITRTSKSWPRMQYGVPQLLSCSSSKCGVLELKYNNSPTILDRVFLDGL